MSVVSVTSGRGLQRGTMLREVLLSWLIYTQPSFVSRRRLHADFV